MTCQETDYLREFDFLDFPVDDKLFHNNIAGVPQFSQNNQLNQYSNSNVVYSQANNHSMTGNTQQHFHHQHNQQQNLHHYQRTRPGFYQPYQQPTSRVQYNQQQSRYAHYNAPHMPKLEKFEELNDSRNEFTDTTGDLLTNLSFEFEEKDIFHGFDAFIGGKPGPGINENKVLDLQSLRTSSDINSSSDTIALFDSRSTRIKRERDIKLEKPHTVTKKRKLNTNLAMPTIEENTSAALKFKTKQKRTKWLRKEVQSLWEGIALYGNNWRLIKKKAFGHRTYYQVKDKGRRILSSQGWSSGRTKATHDGAAEEAKMIAEKVILMSAKVKPAVPTNVAETSDKLPKLDRTANDITSNVGSTAESSSDRDTELDFDLDLDCI